MSKGCVKLLPNRMTLEMVVHDLKVKRDHCIPEIEASCPEKETCVKRFYRFVRKQCDRLRGR